MQIAMARVSIHPDIRRRILDEEGALAIDPSIIASEEEVHLACHLAEKSFKEKSNIGRKMNVETLLWLCGKTDIESAFRVSAPKGDEMIIIAPVDAMKVVRRLDGEEMPVDLEKKATAMALERISLSRI